MLSYKIINKNEHPDLLNKCYDIRKKVFVEEQKFDINIEIDEIDDYAKHILVFFEEKSVATARFFKQNNYWVIGRVCVLEDYRKKSIGSFIIRNIEKEIKKGNVKISSQKHCINFYEKLGYEAYGDFYDDEGCIHRSLKKNLI